jgi:hypothetical protein
MGAEEVDMMCFVRDATMKRANVVKIPAGKQKKEK